MGSKYKRKSYSLNEKIEILFMLDSKIGRNEIARQKKMSPSTISDIKKNREKILRALEDDVNPEAKRIRRAPYADMEHDLYAWIEMMREHKQELSGSVIKTKASKILDRRDENGELKELSDRWMQNFMRRFELRFTLLHGNSSEIDWDAARAWIADLLLPKLYEYRLEDIFNADETGVFWKAKPKKSLILKGEKSNGGKVEKDRITVLVACSMAGERLPLLLIGKSAHPRCWKHSIPKNYKANSNSWMTLALFEEWLDDLNQRMMTENRRILLLIDNFSGHMTKKRYDFIELLYFPPNMTSALQVFSIKKVISNLDFKPCDMGIIANLKIHYRKIYLSDRIEKIEKEQPTKIYLNHARRFLIDAWSKVNPSTIRNCFRKAFLLDDNYEPADYDVIILDLANIWSKLKITETTLDEYLWENDGLLIEDIHFAAQTDKNIENQEQSREYGENIPDFEYQEHDLYL